MKASIHRLQIYLPEIFKFGREIDPIKRFGSSGMSSELGREDGEYEYMFEAEWETDIANVVVIPWGTASATVRSQTAGTRPRVREWNG